MIKSYIARQEDFRNKKWFLVDADGKTLGRLATRVANVLRGKDKPVFTPHVDTGDFVIIVNAEKIKLTGKKWSQKIYRRHSQHPGGLKSATAAELRERDPQRIIVEAVQGMLPHNILSRSLIKKLKVFKGPEHTHSAQKPEILEV